MSSLYRKVLNNRLLCCIIELPQTTYGQHSGASSIETVSSTEAADLFGAYNLMVKLLDFCLSLAHNYLAFGIICSAISLYRKTSG